MSILKVKIDLSKIDEKKVFNGKNGARYLDASILLKDNNETDEYGHNGMIVQDVSKEERERGVKGAILGNSFTIEGKKAADAKRTGTTSSKPSANNAASDMDDDLPF